MTMTIITKIKSFLKWIHRINQKQWFIFSIITTTIGIWFPLIVNFLGLKLHLVQFDVDGNKELTIIGWILTSITIAWSLLSNIAQRYHEQVIDRQPFENESMNILLYPLRTSFYNLCNLKLSGLLKKIGNIKDGTSKIDGLIIETPCKQLEEISVQLANTISMVLTTKSHNLKPEDLYISIYYNFPEESEKWYLAEKHGEIHGLSISELLKYGTTFSYLLNEKKKRLVFFNSKQEAIEKAAYVPDSSDIYDKSTNMISGSILCYKRTFKSADKTLINCMICISTTDKPMLKNPSNEIIRNMEEYMEKTALKEFSARIGIELCFHYLQRLKNTSQRQNS